MIKEWTIKFCIVVAVVIFLLDDVLNWKMVKERITSELSSRGVEIEKIERLTIRGAVFTGVQTQGHKIDRLAVSYDTIHLCANGMKWLLNRTDYFQELTVNEMTAQINEFPIALKKPLKVWLTPENIAHGLIEVKIGSGDAIIHAGDLKNVAQQIELHQVFIPQAKGTVSGTVHLSNKQYSLHYSSENTSAHVKGRWNSQFETVFAGEISLDTLKSLPFTGKLNPSLENLANSALQINGKWNGTLQQLYGALGSDFALVQGNVAVDWEIRGLIAEPSITGKAVVSEGTFEAPAIGLFLNNLSGTIEGNNKYWVVKELHAQDTELTRGLVTGTGWLDISQPNFCYSLNLQVNNVAVLMMDNLTGISSGDLQLNGDKAGAKLVGNGLIHALKLVIDKRIGSKKAPLDIVFIDDLPPPTKPPYPVVFDIDLKLEKHALIEGDNLQARWSGGAHLGGTVKDLRLKGDMKLVQGEYCLNGRDITIKEGVIRFDGNILKETTVFAIATMELKELIAEIIVRGHLDTLSLTLRSNPPLPQREILSWVLFNQGAKHITALQGEQLNRSLSEFTKGGGQKNPLAELQGKLGIDRIDLDRRGLIGDEEVSLKLGKYLSKNLFVGVSKGINADVNRIGFEASLNEHWKVQGEIGDNAEGQMHLKWKNDY